MWNGPEKPVFVKGLTGMDLVVSTTADNAKIKIVGAIDERGAQKLKEAFAGIDLETRNYVIFDFSDVTHIGSAGIGKLLMFYQKLASRGINIKIENASSNMRELLLELRLDSLFQVN